MKSSSNWIWGIEDMLYLYAGEWKVIFNSDSLLQLVISFCKYLVTCGLSSLFSEKLSVKYSNKKVLYGSMQSNTPLPMSNCLLTFLFFVATFLIWWSDGDPKVRSQTFSPTLSFHLSRQSFLQIHSMQRVTKVTFPVYLSFLTGFAPTLSSQLRFRSRFSKIHLQYLVIYFSKWFPSLLVLFPAKALFPELLPLMSSIFVLRFVLFRDFLPLFSMDCPPKLSMYKQNYSLRLSSWHYNILQKL